MTQLVLCRTFPPMLGGIERYTCELFRRAGLDVHVVAPKVADSHDFDRDLPFTVSRYPLIPMAHHRKWPLLSMAVWAAGLVTHGRPNVVYSDQVQSGAVGIPLSRLTGAPHVTFAYGLELSPKRLYRLKRAVFSGSAAVLAISRFARDAVIAVYGIQPELVVVAPPGVDTSRFVPRGKATVNRARIGLEPDDLVLLTVGRLDPSQRYKGYDRLIRLVGHLYPQLAKLRLIVVGEGGDRGRLEAFARSEGVADRVTFTGRISDELLPEVYRLADLFVLASGEPETDPFCVEGYGIVLAEAAASGLPSVAYRVGGTGDVIQTGVTGVLTVPREETFCSAVRELLLDKERRENMGYAARQHAVKTLGWETAVRTLQELSSRLSTKPSPTGPLFRGDHDRL